MVLLACYLGLAYLTHATKNVYVYRFLNPAPKLLNANGENIGGVGNLVAAYVVGIAVGIIAIFCIVKRTIRVRRWVTEVKLGRTGKFCAGRGESKGALEVESQSVWEKTSGE